jgi:hypothetical protein
MARFLYTRGRTTLGIGICSRCSIKMPLGKLSPDPNYPGLMVCDKDKDQYDPYRLPARQPEKISLPFTRPDAPLNEGVPTVAPPAPTPSTFSVMSVRDDD